MATRELLVTWLNDAYSMEKSLVPVLKNHAKDAEEYPEVRERDEQHLEETKRHVELVEQCLERLGEKPSGAKSALGSVFGRMQAMSTEPFKDEMMKNFLADYATEQFEIASYKSLIAIARHMGEEEIASTCEEILADEERMADWLDRNMARAVETTIKQEQAS